MIVDLRYSSSHDQTRAVSQWVGGVMTDEPYRIEG